MLSPCSVLTVREPIDKKKGFLICTDGTKHCTKSMRQAAVLADNLNYAITVMSVSPEEEQLPVVKLRLKSAKQQLLEMGIENVKTISRTGKPVGEVLEIAKRYEIVVIADSGKSRLKRFFKGSDAFDIMGQAPVSVMNVR